MERTTTYSTSAHLSYYNYELPTLNIEGRIPSKYTEIIITRYDSDEVVELAGLHEDGKPYFSDEFYQELRKKYDEVVKYDKERARNLFWFDVKYVNCEW